MGFKLSPHLAMQFLAIALETCTGDPLQTSNPFYWDSVKLNLPGLIAFNPSLSWIYECNRIASAVVGDFLSFADDFRFT